ncbi:MAG: sulfatase, partial [Candidatus Sumerlaeota bacterium]|nr:sulfatase [Candidatus Sumerlaeota bacterium]
MPIPSLAGLKAANPAVNVVLIVLDTQRVKNMSCYGYPKPTTPNSDRIAAEGVLFENHFSPGCWTLPSHTSMFTGLYPFTHRADIEHAYLDDADPTWAEIARKLSYRTAAFNPNTWIRAAQADRGFHLIDSCECPANRPSKQHFTVERFTQWIEAYRGDAKPFFCFLNFSNPHLKCRPAEPFLSQFLQEGVTVEEAMALDQNPHHATGGIRRWTEREWALLESLNDGCVAEADAHVGEVCEALRREGLMDRTLLLITSDHGDVYDEHPPQMAHVMNVYDACLHTPLIARLPEVFEGGRRCPSLVQNVDFLPTFLDVVGAAPHDSLNDIQGLSLLRALHGETREFIYAEDPYPWNEL